MCEDLIPDCSPGLSKLSPCLNTEGGYICNIQSKRYKIIFKAISCIYFLFSVQPYELKLILECPSRAAPTMIWSSPARADYFNKKSKDKLKTTLNMRCTRPGGCKP